MKEIKIVCFNNGTAQLTTGDTHFDNENLATRLEIDFSKTDYSDKPKWVDIIVNKTIGYRYELGTDEIVSMLLTSSVLVNGEMVITPIVYDGELKVKYRPNYTVGIIDQQEAIDVEPGETFDFIFQLKARMDELENTAIKDFDDLETHPTTLEGYGITDVYDKTEIGVALDLKADNTTVSDLDLATEKLVNKKTTLAESSDVDYPTVKAVKDGLDLKVDKVMKIIGIDLQNDILIDEFKTALGKATQSLDGLLSAEDKKRLDILIELLNDDDNNEVVNTIAEVLAIFDQYPEGVDLVSVLADKVNKEEGKGLSENDLTAALKSNYDAGYNHSQVETGNPHKTKFDDLANKPTTLEGYGITDAIKDFADLENKPTTLAGYGITDGASSPASEERTEDYTLSNSDNGKVLYMNSEEECNFMLPANADVEIDIDFEIRLVRVGTGIVCVRKEEEVIANGSTNALKHKITQQYDSVVLKKIATDTWLVFGKYENIDDIVNYSIKYLTFESATDDFTVKPAHTQTGVSLQYSVDDGDTWKNIASGAITTSSKKTLFRGKATGVKSLYTTLGAAWAITCANPTVEVYGNINSLLDSDFGAWNLPTTVGNYAFGNLFNGQSKIKNISNLILPATTLGNNCYQQMFSSCPVLTTAPKLPATTLAVSCYQFMFYGCTGIEIAPELPATTLADSCYDSMLYSCTGIEIAPELPATTLADSCYDSMFRDCLGLTTVPSLPATTLAYNCYYNMFENCASLETAPSLPATTLANNCYDKMFYRCSGLTTAPELPATTLADNCYYDMFSGCTSLTTAPELPATTLGTRCYYNMFIGCTSLTTPPSLPATTLAVSCYQFMFSGCRKLTTAPSLPATTLANSCYGYMLRGCSLLKFSQTKVGDYQYAWTIPATVGEIGWNSSTILSTGGTFTGDPQLNTTYYTTNEPV